MLLLPEQIDRQLVDLYRAWDELERKQNDNTIIDFDLASARHFPPIHSRDEVLERLKRFAADLEEEGSGAAELAHARLKASMTYLRALSGEAIDFRRYIE